MITRNEMPGVDVWPLGLTRVKMFTSLLGKICFLFLFFYFYAFLNDKTTRGKQHMDRRGLLLLNLKHDNNLCAFGILNYFEEKIRLCS